MKKLFFIFPILVVLIAFSFYRQKLNNTFSLVKFPNSCKAIIVNRPDSQKIYITLKFNKAGIFYNTNEQHGISVLLSKLWFNRIGDLSQSETAEKLTKLGISNLTLNGMSGNFVISFNVIDTMFEPAIDFIISGLKPKFSDNELSYAKEFIPIPVNPEIASPSEILSDKLYYCLFPNHVYGKNTTGSSETIPSVTLNDINKFLQSNFALDNLTIYFAGKYSKQKLKILVNSLEQVLPTKSKLNAFPKLKNIEVNSRDQNITNKNIRDVCGVMTGFRFDELSPKEIASLFIIADTLFDESFGKFKIKKLPINFSFSIDNKKHSTILILSSFVLKQDLDTYLKELNNLLDTITLDQLDNLNLSKKYFLKKQKRGLCSLLSIPDSLTFLALPFKKCNTSDYQNILQKIKNQKIRCTVTISGESSY